jgi:CPA2 family monovalent cation:H+ antiporter-2
MPLLSDIVIIFGLSIAVLFIFHRLRLPAIVGFLLTGILAGPHGLALIKAVHEVETLAEIGVVLLLFTIGIEFSLKNLLQIKRSVLAGGSLQVLLTILIFFGVSLKTGRDFGESVFIGFLVALSSTAIVLSLLQERAEIDSPHGRTTLAILIFQDIVIVPMILFTPLLAGMSGISGQSLVFLLAKGIGIIILVIASAKWIVPKVLYQITRTRNRELFLLSIIVICLGIAWLTYKAGLSLALGAFLAGLIISESEYSHQALGNILPFRDVFTSFFFISVGMLLDIGFLFQRPGLILLIALAVMILKTIIACLAVFMLGYPIRIAILAGLALCQVGEFSFILSRGGVEYGLLSADTYQFFLSVSIVSMAATPFIIALAPHAADILSRLPMPAKLRSGLYPVKGIEGVESIYKKDHLIIVGFGLNGRNLARAARIAKIPYAIIEMNPETVMTEKAKGEEICYGDATQEAVLEHANIKNARILVVAINDPAATRRITELAGRLNPNLCIIVRTRYLQEMKPLYELGAKEVIPEEFETSVEIFTRVLTKYLVPRDEIEKFVSEVRADGYEMLRGLFKESVPLSEFKLNLPGFEISVLRVGEGSPVVGKSLAEIELRKKYGITLLGVRRGSEMMPNPGGDTVINANDLLVVLGLPDKVIKVGHLFL